VLSALSVITVTTVTACSTTESRSGGSAPDSSVDRSASPTSVPTSGGVPAPFAGADDAFYTVPDPLVPAPPGTLIRVQPIAGDADRATESTRVMYHSRDVLDRDRAVTGVITVPRAPAPAEGWPVVAWAHGTTGLTSICAPSRNLTRAPTFGINGVGVATDYIGLGPLGERHAYLSGASEGHSVIDAVRAARHLASADVSTRWLAIGHSQGGHAALFTNQLGESYAPELDLLGTVAIAPAAVLDQTFGPADQIVPRMVGIMALYGIATDHPELDVNDYVSAAAAEHEHIIDEGCTAEIVTEMLEVPFDTFYDHDPITTEPAKSIVAENDPGRVRVDAPLLLVQGDADTWVVPARTDALRSRLCTVGQVVDLVTVKGATHDSVVAQGGAAITTWLEGRLANTPAPDTC
jgi:dienelactone hydrolase